MYFAPEERPVCRKTIFIVRGAVCILNPSGYLSRARAHTLSVLWLIVSVKTVDLFFFQIEPSKYSMSRIQIHKYFAGKLLEISRTPNNTLNFNESGLTRTRSDEVVGSFQLIRHFNFYFHLFNLFVFYCGQYFLYQRSPYGDV